MGNDKFLLQAQTVGTWLFKIKAHVISRLQFDKLLVDEE